MKKIFFFLSLGCLFAFAFRTIRNTSRTGENKNKDILSAVDCAAPESKATADAHGHYIPALGGLGKHAYRISTKSDSAQLFFNQGLSFYYSYHLKEAAASFLEATRYDSANAMVYWGQALASGPYYNAYYYKVKPAVAGALRKMQLYRASATSKEAGLEDALLKRYSADTTNADRPFLDSVYAVQMKQLAALYPADNDIKCLYVDAVMLAHKWDFWKTDETAEPWTNELVAICEEVLRQDPHQPAAQHYYIHITEASPHPERALAAAEQLRLDMPGVGHMVHMSTHMYQRNGLFPKGVLVNEESTTASNREDSLAPMLALGKNNIIHVFAVQSFCAIDAGMFSQGMPVYLRARDRCIASHPVFEQDLYAQMVYMLPEIAWVRVGKWDFILADPAPDPKWTYASILYEFARGMACIHNGDLAAAKRNLDSLRGKLGDSLLNVRSKPFNKPAQSAAVAADLLEGVLLVAQGHNKAGIGKLQDGVAEEDALIYREPKEWMLPVRQYLGKEQLSQHEYVSAEQTFRLDLHKNPGNGWSLLGLSQSLAAQHKTAEAANFRKKYLTAFQAADQIPAASAY